MRIQLIGVGEKMPGWVEAGYRDYEGRLGGEVRLELREIPAGRRGRKADLARGHTFTDRLLHARGIHETWFLGADTISPLVEELLPTARIVRRPRMSTLRHSGPHKLTSLPPRSAVVAFSAADVYATAELMRRRRGGTAVVLGALSPRTRNAQVAMYQAGEVDYLVATDAVGMGLNLDVHHVAFSSLTKFDGRRMRPLQPNELAQIAGRA